MKVTPLHNRVVILPNAVETVSAGGIVIPDSAAEKVTQGVVMAVGPGVWVRGELRPCSVKEGDKVIYAKYGGTEVDVGGKKLLIVVEDDILAVV